MTLQIGKQYFEGYEEKFVPKTNGKGFRKKRVYLGDIYHIEGSEKTWVTNKICMLLAAITYFAIMIGFGTLQTLSNVSTYVTLPYAIGLLSGGYCFIGICNRMMAPYEMTAFQYNEQYKQIQKGSFCALCAMVLCFSANTICLIIWLCSGVILKGMLLKEVAMLIAHIVSAFLMLVVYNTGKNTIYIKIQRKQCDD